MKVFNKAKNFVAGLLVTASLAGNIKAANINGDVDIYHDIRGYPTLTINIYGSELPGKTNFFGFVDSFGSRKNPLKWSSYGEFKLSRNFWNELGAAVEYDRDSSVDYGITRAGISFEPKLSIKDYSFGLTFYPFASHNDKMQLVLYGEKRFRKGESYVRGFMDLNFKDEGAIPFTEVQVGKRLKDNLYFVVEGRYNGFVKGKDSIGLGVGLEYKF